MGEKKGPQKKEELSDRDKIIISSIEAGVNSLVSQPGLKNYALSFRKELSHEKIYSVANEIEKYMTDNNIPEEKRGEFLYNNLASYIASGNALSPEWKKIILEKGYEGKSKQNPLEKLVHFFKPHKFDGETYLEKATSAYGNIQERYAKNKLVQEEIPEVGEAIRSLSLNGFLEEALANFMVKGMIDKKEYNKLSKMNNETNSLRAYRGMKGIEKHILSEREKEEKLINESYQKAAAIFFFLFGAALLLVTGINLTHITGNAIGTVSPSTSGIISIILIFVSLLLFFLFRRHSK